MGADLGPAEIVAAVRLAIDSIKDLDPIALVGRREELEPLLRSARLEGHPLVEVHHASEVIAMNDKPLRALRTKKDSSMVRAIELVKAREAKVLVSCGNTGSLMAGGTLKLRTLEGIERPALATVIPHKKGHFVLIDAGANPEARPEHLVHNAILGSRYCSIALKIDRPRVGLLTIGTEEGKGTERVNDTHELLKAIGDLIDYRGPIEGFHVFDDQVDVVVCDGFTGNILLKTCESLFKLLRGYLKEELMRNPLRQLGAFLSRGAFKAMQQQLQPERYGGAPLLGLRGNILKAHGSSNRVAIMNAIRIAHEIIRTDLNEKILDDIAKANEALSPAARSSS